MARLFGLSRTKAADLIGAGAVVLTSYGILRNDAPFFADIDRRTIKPDLESVRRKTGNSVIYRRGAIRRVLRAREDAGDDYLVILPELSEAELRVLLYVIRRTFGRPATPTAV